ncbi:nitrate- and nitrite sensing domain-containing protein [Streptomyces sp. NBC_01795]|uniref:nitrate- and nitrite sensing domain-containing protein n=1 Tax=unclassified Streptomyces TaxID=2593676 RepID=UPI002DD8844A|nr:MULTISPECIES: nitrate- and nitrite sensing domain-containing protein [unclassified Streptomyces]WSA96531.1 nitrate- and nitrite sensing domain-containing protein [Streptomyces sp. NBC_01795]WSB80945.1 nitrate- and nitrite sensing domain-containing protein [Streptomyces sp. NBC_01775]WSS10846.1 nitrate- and nitrite sensing domain-containing protein [Streptomyces sp. NBC_01186]
MRFRGKSIRRKIVVLLLVPLVSLVSIWGFATYITASEANGLLQQDEITREIGNPTEGAVKALQRERRQILVHLADPRRTDSLTALRKFQRETDRKVSTVRGNAAQGGLRSDLDADADARLDDLLDALDGLGKLRSKVEHNTITRGGAFQAYNELVAPAYAVLDSLNGVDDADLEKQGRALVGVTRAREYLSREDALMAAAYVAGQFTRGDQRALSDRVAERNIVYQASLSSLPAEDRQIFENYWDGTDGRTLRSYEDAVIAAGPRSSTGPVGSQRWNSAMGTVLDDLDRMDQKARDRYEERIAPVATRVLIQAAAAGVLGFLAVLASLVISFRVGRGLVRDLNILRKEANESAGVRLPSVMRRLASGEHVDVETESPRLDYPPDEMGQVGQALNTLQRAALEAAVKQADMRRGVSEVFVNLARRNQVLLHRQLTLLDAMERRTEDSDELADLFRIDHLTTRMRRHAEGLVILSGAAPSRQWRKPVQLMDVVRAAVGEVEDYERIEVRRLPRLAVDGSAVADLTHLIAELLENATVFSPPHTAVQVLGERVVNGFTLEIHDRGLGMTAEALLDANLRLAETPEFELSDTDRLGLFVVSRLAQRQGVRVSLQPSPYGGTTAVVLIPGAVLTETPERDGEVAAGRRTAIESGPHRRRDGAEPRGRKPETRGPKPAAGEDETPDPLSQPTVPLLDGGRERRALDGPVELEAPLDGPDAPDTGGRPFPRRERGTSPASVAPAGEQHQQARDEAGPSSRGETRTGPRAGEPGPPDEPAPPDGPAPLPRRRPGAPVLVSDHGRPVDTARQDQSERDRDSEENGTTRLPRRRKPAPAPAEETEPPASSPESAPTPEPGPRSGGPAGIGGLPRRVRQASLAPQLRTDTPAQDSTDAAPAPGPSTTAAPGPAERDAEEVRSKMASLQRGWERGRRDNEEREDADRTDAQDNGAHGTHSENGAPGSDPSPSGDAAGEPAQGTTPEGDGR